MECQEYSRSAMSLNSWSASARAFGAGFRTSRNTSPLRRTESSNMWHFPILATLRPVLASWAASVFRQHCKLRLRQVDCVRSRYQSVSRKRQADMDGMGMKRDATANVTNRQMRRRTYFEPCECMSSEHCATLGKTKVELMALIMQSYSQHFVWMFAAMEWNGSSARKSARTFFRRAVRVNDVFSNVPSVFSELFSLFFGCANCETVCGSVFVTFLHLHNGCAKLVNSASTCSQKTSRQSAVNMRKTISLNKMRKLFRSFWTNPQKRFRAHHSFSSCHEVLEEVGAPGCGPNPSAHFPEHFTARPRPSVEFTS